MRVRVLATGRPGDNILNITWSATTRAVGVQDTVDSVFSPALRGLSLGMRPYIKLSLTLLILRKTQLER